MNWTHYYIELELHDANGRWLTDIEIGTQVRLKCIGSPDGPFSLVGKVVEFTRGDTLVSEHYVKIDLVQETTQAQVVHYEKRKASLTEIRMTELPETYALGKVV